MDVDNSISKLTSSDPSNLYEQAFEYMRKSDYNKADILFKQFIASNQDNELVSNSYYWIGEMFFLQNNYEKSAVNFLKGYQEKPKGNKADYNLMKLGMSLDKLNKKTEACTTFAKVLNEFLKLIRTLEIKLNLNKNDLNVYNISFSIITHKKNLSKNR